MLISQMVYRHNNCLNTKRPYAKSCRLCIDNCPHQAISPFHEIEPKLCTECGLCMAICPSDGFVDNYTGEFHYYLESAEEEIVLNCPQAAPLGYEIPCLGILDRDLWLYLLLEGKERKVTFFTGKCGECPDKKACAHSVKIFNKIHEEWPEHPPVSIKVVTEANEELAETYEKTALLVKKITKSKDEEKKTWREKGWKKLEKALPGLTSDEAYDIPLSRQLLLKSMDRKHQEKLPIPALLINKDCTSCGVCASICPQKALTKREKGEELTLIFEPYKCVPNCDRCVNVCSPKAMSFETKNLPHRHFTGKILLHKGSPKHCVRCDKLVFDNSEPPLCIACASSSSDSLFSS
ncbi:MAG: 4Fe-4S binding protein [Desulfitobacterium sp.]|nr:4Fe-4S binding protein [Desulfitobacterium sp.]